MPRKEKSFVDFFWTRVKKTDGCWIWTGAKLPKGYGLICIDGITRERITASRASWIIHNGPISTNKLHVCHHCDVPACVNPEHLFLGTAKDNLQDASRKGRMSVPGKGWERNKTHCKHGHPFNEENTYRYGNHRLAESY